MKLHDEVESITAYYSVEALTYLDEDGQQFEFILADSFEGFENEYVDIEATCDNGSSFKPFKVRERRSRTYVSSNNDSIILSVYTFSSFIARSEDEIDSSPGPVLAEDIFEVQLVFEDCDKFVAARFINQENSGSNIVLSSFPFQKHGQFFDDLFGVRADRWIGELMFSLSKGLIAFNHCGRDWVQRAD